MLIVREREKRVENSLKKTGKKDLESGKERLYLQPLNGNTAM